MGITVREALKLGTLRKAKIVAGKEGLNRKIDYVLTIDVPDAAKWNKGNELLLTSTYIFINNPEFIETIVYELVEKESAALAIKAGRFLDKIPQQIIDAGNEKNFPILELPNDISWHDIVNPVMIEIFNKEVGQLKRSQQIHSSLTDAVLRGGGLNAVAKTLSMLLNCGVFIEDEGFNLLSYYFNEPIDAISRETVDAGKLPKDVINELETKRILEKIKKYKKSHRVNYRSRMDCFPRVITPIVLNDEIYGYIVLIEKTSKVSTSDLIVAEQAADIAALEIMKNQAVKEAEGKIKKEFLENILNGQIKDEHIIKSRLNKYGVNIENAFAIIMVLLDYENALRLERQDFLSLHEPFGKDDNYIIFRKGEEIIIIFGFKQDTNLCKKYGYLGKICGNIFKHLESNSLSSIIGASDIYDTTDNIPQSYKEARLSIEILDKIRDKKRFWTLYKDVWIYDLLLSHDNLNRLCVKSIKKLAEHDKKNNENLLNTLKVYLDNMGKNNITSKKLFIHRNTLKYRLNRIQEILECDLKDPSVRLRIELSFRILNIKK